MVGQIPPSPPFAKGGGQSQPRSFFERGGQSQPWPWPSSLGWGSRPETETRASARLEESRWEAHGVQVGPTSWPAAAYPPPPQALRPRRRSQGVTTQRAALSQGFEQAMSKNGAWWTP